MERGHYTRGRRGPGDYRGRRHGPGGPQGGRGGRGGRGGGGRGGGVPESKEAGAEATQRALHGLTLSVQPPARLQVDKMTLARRPDAGGRAGHRVEVLANFFKMMIGVETVYHYNVDIIQRDERLLGEADVPATGPMLLPISLCRDIIETCARQNRWPSGWVYDGKKNIYSPVDHFGRQRTTFEVNLGSEMRPRIFEVGIQYAATINMLNLHRYLERGDIPVPREAIQSIEVCLRFSASNRPGCHLAGRSIYFDDGATNIQLPQGGDLWCGYHQGVKLCQQGLALNLETTAAAFIRRRPVIELLQEAVGRNIDHCRHMDRGMWNEMKKAVSNVLVRTTHGRQPSKPHRCRGLTDRPAAQATFDLRDGRHLSVAQYWQEKYGRLNYEWLPCLDVSKGDKPTYLPVEVCETVPGQRLQKLNEEQTRVMIRMSARKPDERVRQVHESLRRANINSDPAARSFGIQVHPEMMKVEARVLPQPHLEYVYPPCMDTGDRGAWNLENVKFLKPGTIRSWSIVSFVSKRISMSEGEQSLFRFVQDMKNMLQQMGLTVANNMPPLVHRETKTVEEALQEGIQEATRQYREKPDIVLVLLERKENFPYQDVKRYAERDMGITTQCFVARNAGIGCPSRGRPQYLANLAMKINHKVGGVNTQIVMTIGSAFPVLGQGQNKPFIVFGASITHPTGFDRTEPSVGAIVASMDPYLGQFETRVFTMGHREEKMDMRDAMVELFREFYVRSRVRPEAIFFYRDGVSEGQFEDVLKHEYSEIRKACTTLSPSYNPPITHIVVQKMHHTRFFPARPEFADRNGNVKPGTCVDTGITANYEFDFYLNSHAGIQGTNKPAHYYVLVDENGFGSDGLQLFSYWMCYLYCRCTRSVSYVPPAYYAHLAALHGRYLVGRQSDSSSEASNGNGRTSMFHENLNSKMFFV